MNDYQKSLIDRKIFCRRFHEHLKAVNVAFQDYNEMGATSEDGNLIRELQTRCNFMFQLVQVEHKTVSELR